MTPRPLGHSFPNGIQQDLPCERLAQIADAPGVHRLIARGLVVVRRHEDDRALRFLRGGCRAAGRFPSARCRSRATPPRRRMSGFRCRCAPTAAPRPSESHAASELRGKAVRLRLVCSFALAQVQRELRRSSPPRQEFHFMVTERGADTRGVPVVLQFTDASGGISQRS